MGKSLDDLYSADVSDSTGVSQATEAAAKPEPQAEAPKAEGQQPATDVVKQGEPPSPQESPDDKVPKAALTDERKKRQAVEAQNKEIQRRLDELEKRLAAPQEPQRPTDPLVDPEGFMREIEAARFEDRLEITSQFVRSQVGEDKYDAAEQAVLRAASQNQQFAQRFAEEVARARNPGKYTYEVGAAIIEQMEANDPAKARAKLRDEIKAELMAELGLTPQRADKAIANGSHQAVAKPSVPTSLAGLQSVGPRNPGVRPVKRRSLDELYNR